MSNSIPISGLNELTVITSSDFIPLVQSSSLTTFKVSIQSFDNWLAISASCSASLTSVSASYAKSASHANQSDSASFLIYAGYNNGTASYALNSLSASNVGGIASSASWASSSVSSSYVLSASHANQADTASYLKYPNNSSASFATRAGWADTASYAIFSRRPTPMQGDCKSLLLANAGSGYNPPTAFAVSAQMLVLMNPSTFDCYTAGYTGINTDALDINVLIHSVGTVGGLDAGTVDISPSGSWYHVWVISQDQGQAVYGIFSKTGSWAYTPQLTSSALLPYKYCAYIGPVFLTGSVSVLNTAGFYFNSSIQVNDDCTVPESVVFNDFSVGGLGVSSSISLVPTVPPNIITIKGNMGVSRPQTWGMAISTNSMPIGLGRKIVNGGRFNATAMHGFYGSEPYELLIGGTVAGQAAVEVEMYDANTYGAGIYAYRMTVTGFKINR